MLSLRLYLESSADHSPSKDSVKLKQGNSYSMSPSTSHCQIKSVKSSSTIIQIF